VVHIGGDEVPSGVWAGSPACRALQEEQGDLGGQAGLFAYFVRQFGEILSARGLVTAGWEEIAVRHVSGSPAEPDPDAAGRGYRPHVWNSVWGWGAEELAYKLANAGYDVVLSNVSNLYFDLAYTKDPEEPGYYWGGFVDTYQPWSFVPLDLYKNATADLLGRPLPEDRFARATRLTPEGRRRILGLQGQLWAENAKGPELLEYLLLPKMLGLAERAWAADPAWAALSTRAAREKPTAEAWNRFVNTVGRRELPRLDNLAGGVAYRVPPPGARVKDGVVEANVIYPGLAIRYTTDGSEPTPESALYEAPVPLGGQGVRLRTFTSTGRGSRTVSPARE
jgi:hexosaminidase